jgi:MFS family permease
LSSPSARNTLLAAGAAFGVMAAVLQLISATLTFSDYLRLPAGAFTDFKVAAGLDVLQWVFGLAAFGTALAAFLLAPRSRRTTVLAVAAGLFVGYGLAQLAGNLVLAIFESSHSAPWQFIGAESAGAAAGAIVAIAALLVAVGIRSSRPDGRLGSASIVLAGSFALLCASYSLELAGYLDFPFTVPGRVSGGLGTTAAGYFVEAVAALVAGVAFLTSNSRRRRGEAWQAQRESSLGIAASVFAVGFLVASAGRMLVASLEGGTSRNKAEEWLQAVGLLLLALAAVCGAVGFFVSSHEAGRRGSPPAAPAPAV